jgi:hypothetical protein
VLALCLGLAVTLRIVGHRALFAPGQPRHNRQREQRKPPSFPRSRHGAIFASRSAAIGIKSM